MRQATTDRKGPRDARSSPKRTTAGSEEVAAIRAMDTDGERS